MVILHLAMCGAFLLLPSKRKNIFYGINTSKIVVIGGAGYLRSKNDLVFVVKNKLLVISNVFIGF